MTHNQPRCQKNPSRSFNGLLQDEKLKFMAIDSFVSHTRGCKVFLLSHHHADHMYGLNSFINELHQSPDQFIYTSALTAEYLKNTRRINPNKIISLPINKPFNVYKLDDDSDVTVTCTPAAHCPGSVMFLIEYHRKKILYTGDFRMNLSEFKTSQKYLMNSNGTCKGVDDIYIDSTFALPAGEIPHREQAEELIMKFAEEWLMDTSMNRKLVIPIHTCIGGEHLFVSLAKKFKTLIAVHQETFNIYYDAIENIRPYFRIVHNIVEDENWLIHACRRCSGTGMTCDRRAIEKYQIRVIKPCALSFFLQIKKNQKDKNGVPFIDEIIDGCSSVKVYYSHHSSLEELQEIVRFLAPKNVFLNTVYEGYEEVMQSLFDFRPRSSNGRITHLEKRIRAKVCPALVSEEEYLEAERLKVIKAKELNLFD